ncbi:urea transporter [Paraburkholderia sartisoli]|uniref:Urea transporter n=2 Tax=Paraburkholderia sartisoli TaxID=83784 RepID=A0A1H4HRH0_9BURK|nr:urea transporter [Paraburkholderia sartisoli]
MPRAARLAYARGFNPPVAPVLRAIFSSSRMYATTTPTGFTALRTLLRSLGQIVLQGNAATGACVLAALVICDPRLACAALIGVVSANISAVLAGCEEQDTRAGLHGFNGALAALAAFTFIADNATAAAIAILAATATAWMLDPWSRFLQRFHFCGYSSPCLIVTWIWLALVGPVAHTAAPHGASATTSVISSMDVLHGVLAGVAQTTFASGALPGMLVVAGIAASSRRRACWTLAGAALATVGQVLSGVTLSSLDAGLPGFNGALTALAVADCGAIATIAAVALSVLLQQLASHFGWPAMTAPFVIAAWCAHGITRVTTRQGSTSHIPSI